MIFSFVDAVSGFNIFAILRTNQSAPSVRVYVNVAFWRQHEIEGAMEQIVALLSLKAATWATCF